MASVQQQTLIFIRDEEDKVLLGLKKRNFGINKWNGYGGKCNIAEDPLTCAIRELKEESGLEANNKNLQQIALLKIHDSNSKSMKRAVHVYTAKMDELSGELMETSEMRPKKFRINQIPYEDMWADAVYWLPAVFGDQKFLASIYYSEDNILDAITIQLSNVQFN